MFKIEGNTIKITRGDKATIGFSIEDYTFMQGDKIRFAVYERKSLESDPVLLKEIIVEEETESIEINLTSEDTTIGELINKPVEYWYEIELNDDITVVGYDDIEGEKIFELYPEGREIE